ncbi:MAG: hypothetical protein ACK5HT_21810 [Draconibacterium sp.]
MSKQFSNRIFLCPADQIPEVIEAPYDGFDPLHSDIDIDPSVKQGEKDGNVFYDFTLRVAFSGIPAATISKYRNNRPFIALLFDVDGNAYQAGTRFYRLRSAIDSRQFVSVWNISAQLLSDPFL